MKVIVKLVPNAKYDLLLKGHSAGANYLFFDKDTPANNVANEAQSVTFLNHPNDPDGYFTNTT